MCPTLVGFLNKNGTNAEWQKIWIISAILNSFAAICYMIFGSAELQEWGKQKIAKENICSLNAIKLQKLQKNRAKPYIISELQ